MNDLRSSKCSIRSDQLTSMVADENKTVKKADYTVLPRSHALAARSTKLGAYVSKDVIMKKSNQWQPLVLPTGTKLT